MVDAMQISKDMEVVGSDGQHVGTVDRVEGQRIKLTKKDSPSGEHQFLQLDMVAKVQDGTAHLSQPAGDVKRQFS